MQHVAGNATAAAGISDDIVVNDDADCQRRSDRRNSDGTVTVDDNLDVTGDLAVTGNISGTNRSITTVELLTAPTAKCNER